LEYIKYEEFGWLICADFKVREFWTDYKAGLQSIIVFYIFLTLVIAKNTTT
jgi:hypothetical protein